jgi:hypothetical protein
MRPGILAVLTALGSLAVAGGDARAQSFAPTPAAESAAPASVTPRPASKRKSPAETKQAPKPGRGASAAGARAAPAVPAANKAGEVDSANLPGVRESGRRKLGADSATRPVAMPSLGPGMPTVGGNSSRSADSDNAGRKYPGGGVMTGDVSIGGPLGAGPYGR